MYLGIMECYNRINISRLIKIISESTVYNPLNNRKVCENMEFKNFLLTLENGIAVFTINRPEVRNALNAECWEEIDAFREYVERTEEVRVAIITGAGEKAFAAGADLKFLKVRTMVEALDGLAQRVLQRLEDCSKPVIAALNGVAFGGGCELALACDIRIMAENAKMGLPELGLGILPGAGGTQRLAKLIGLGRAKEVILTGRPVEADEAVGIGLVSRAVPRAELPGAAREIAEAIMKKGPLAVRITKKLIAASLSSDERSGMLLELFGYGLVIASEDKAEGVDSFFEKRAPQFKGC